MAELRNAVVFQVGRLDFQGALALSERIRSLRPAERYVIDMARLGYVSPFGMLYVAAQFRAWRSRTPEIKFELINHIRHSYAAYMGFFSAGGFQEATAGPNFNGEDRYIQLTRLRVRDLHVEAGQGAEVVQDVIENRARQMALVLTRGQSDEVQLTLQFCLREVIRNVVEHSNSDYVWYAAQYWPARNMAELSILDEGIGVRSSLDRNPYLHVPDDRSALVQSIMPGISGVAYKGRAPNRDNGWANSGYGLFMLSELCAKGGSFAMCSGDAALLLENGGDRTLQSSFSGTALRLELHLPSLGKIGERLTELNKKGVAIAMGNENAIHAASSSTKILRS